MANRHNLWSVLSSPNACTTLVSRGGRDCDSGTLLYYVDAVVYSKLIQACMDGTLDLAKLEHVMAIRRHCCNGILTYQYVSHSARQNPVKNICVVNGHLMRAAACDLLYAVLRLKATCLTYE